MEEKIFITALVTIAIWATLLNGMIFGFLGNWINEKFPKWLSKPLVECVICMTMYYGSALYWILWGNGIREWVIVVISAMGVTTIFAKTKIR